jgi:hypothetical protein
VYTEVQLGGPGGGEGPRGERPYWIDSKQPDYLLAQNMVHLRVVVPVYESPALDALNSLLKQAP